MPMLVTDNLRQSACYPGVLPLKRFEGELRTTAPPLLVLPSPLLFQLLFDVCEGRPGRSPGIQPGARFCRARVTAAVTPPSRMQGEHSSASSFRRR
eukprot:2416907-Pyramimonas_sp.AAC.2